MALVNEIKKNVALSTEVLRHPWPQSHISLITRTPSARCASGENEINVLHQPDIDYTFQRLSPTQPTNTLSYTQRENNNQPQRHWRHDSNANNSFRNKLTQKM